MHAEFLYNGGRPLLGKAVIVSFEDSIIRVVYASVKGGGIAVKDTLFLNDDQFDNFLLQEKSRQFIVLNSFKDFFQEIVLIPSTKDRYLKTLIESEIRKKAPFTNFSFIHTILGEKVVDGRKMKEVFVYAVRNEEINVITERFVHRDKVVKAFYPDIFAMASLLDSRSSPILCVTETGLNKTLFLVNNGNVCFVRSVQSLEHGIGDLDIQNINMTVNYCWQTFKIGPSVVMIAGHLCRDYNAGMSAAAPVACLTRRYLSGKGENDYDNTAQVSSLLVPSSSKINLLTKEFKSFFQVKQFLIYSSFLFLLFSLIGMGYAAYSTSRMNEMKMQLTSARKALPDIEGIITAYDRKTEELNRYAPYIASLNSSASTPDIQVFLLSLSKLRMDNVRFVSISMTPGEGVVHVELKGSVVSDRYGDAQRYYQQLIENIGKLKGFAVTDRRLDLKSREFFLKADFNDL